MKSGRNILIAGLLAGAGLWVIDAFIDYLIFYEGTFLDMLVLNVPTHELYVRAVGIAILGAFCVGTARHLARRSRAEKVLQESRASLQTVIDAIPDVTLATDRDYCITLANQAAMELAGGEDPVTSGMKCHQFLHRRASPCSGQGSPCPLARVLATRAPATVTHTRRDAEGKDAVMEISAAPIFNDAGDVVQIVETYRDVTRRKRAEEELRTSREQLRALAARLEEVREKERTLLARRIHDELGHALTSLKMDLSWLGKKLAAAGDVRAGGVRERVAGMCAALDDTIETVRQTASDLRPGLLDDLGLAAALEWEVGQLQARSGITCEFYTSTEAEKARLDREPSTALYRICQELLINVARHAGATAVRVALARRADKLILEVSDDGGGITPEQASSPKSLGILGMRERALLLGGEFVVSGKPGGGTTASVQIPIGTRPGAKGQYTQGSRRDEILDSR